MKITQLFMVGIMSLASFTASAETATQAQEQLKQNLQLQQRVGPEVPNSGHIQKKNQYQHQNKNLYQKDGVDGKGLKSDRTQIRSDSRTQGTMNSMGRQGGGKR